MYEFVIHAFLFLGALLGILLFAGILFFIPVLISHEVWAMIHPDNNEENNS